ncbi:YesL family protein [Rossellomorea sp. KS-H15a]|uniref:YesL family protein n=1 Tax=Rossellomorea sp. KS-H15a TaxID=2963940 RepID=UPI0020C72FFE|nr:DUF624 domain-containing protein [Rossellomorea sp. KS-H15a]UTE77425.1 DUF624 domain-containing protein [Rossellomorea sp. KS-H15a]
MELTGWKGGLQYYGNYALKLACLNLLWLGGIVIGAGIAGVFPSTIAMFSVVRKWNQTGDMDLPMATHFKKEYQREFFKGNLYGYTWVIIGVILYVDLLYFRGIPSLPALLFSYVLFIFGVIYLAALLFAFPVYAHYELGIFHCIRNAVLIALSHPLYSVIMALGFYFPYYLIVKIPGLFPLFGGSLIALILMQLSIHIFSVLEEKSKE